MVKWVKGNFLPGRQFTDDQDLAQSTQEWLQMANTRPSSATGIPPLERLREEARTGGPLPLTAADYGLLLCGQVAADATVAALGNRYSVPVTHVGAPVVVRLHRDRVRIYRDTDLVADHLRAPDGGRERVLDPAHFAPLFPHKPRARAMLYREVLLKLGDPASAFIAALSRTYRDRLREEILAIYALYEQHGAAALRAAMRQALDAGACSADALTLLLAQTAAPVPVLEIPGLPAQHEVDRQLAVYERWVQIDEAQEVLG